jgi:hypothetical protein
MWDETRIEDADVIEDGPAESRRGTLYSIGAATLTMAALATVVVWSYRLGVRDANDVPVIKAMVEKMRDRPEDPGGLRVEHQDRRVYGLIVDGASDEDQPAVLAAPPEPLQAEDVAMARLVPAVEAAEPALEETLGESAATDDAAPTATAEAPPAASRARDLEALVREALATPEPITDGLPSPLPRLRPILASASSVDTVEPRAARPTAPTPARPAIQLGAYNDPDLALEMWRSLAARNGDLLAGRDPVVDTLVGTTRTLYGLRAVPFATMAEAEGLCAALQARDEDCLVTVTR